MKKTFFNSIWSTDRCEKTFIFFFEPVKSQVLDRAKNERPKTGLNLAVLFLFFYAQRSVNSVVLTLERNITHDFELAGMFPNICNFSSYVKNVKLFSLHSMTKTALRAPFFMAKLQKLESNGYVNHTVAHLKVVNSQMPFWLICLYCTFAVSCIILFSCSDTS